MVYCCSLLDLTDSQAGNKTKGITGMTREEIVEPFNLSFASDDPAKGGCVTVPPCPDPCKPPSQEHAGELSERVSFVPYNL